MLTQISFILFLLFIGLEAKSQTIVDASKHIDHNITMHAYFYVDKTKKLTIEEVDKIIDNHPIRDTSINYPQSWHNLWFKLNLKNTSLKKIERYLTMAGSFPGNFTYFTKDNGHWIKKGIFGTSLKLEERLLKSARASLSISIDPNEEKEILFLRQTHHLLSLKIIIQDIESFYKYETIKRSQFLFFFGASLILLCVNILLYIYNRNIVQIVYIVFMATLLIFAAAINGVADLYYWGISPGIRHYSPVISMFLLFNAALLLFAFLKLRHKKHFIYRLIVIPLYLPLFYIVLYLLGLDNYLGVPSGKYLQYFITLSITIGMLILIKSIKDKSDGAIFFALSILAFIIPIIYWIISEFYSDKNYIDSEIPFLIGSFFSFTIFNLRYFVKFKQTFEKNQEMVADAAISEKYQNIIRVLTHDLSTPLMLMDTSIKKITKVDLNEDVKHLIYKLNSGKDELEGVILKMRNQEKESSDIALNVCIEQTDLLEFLSRSFESLPFNVDDYKIVIHSIPNLTILCDKDILLNKVISPLLFFILSLIDFDEEVIIKCEKQKKYVYLIINIHTLNKTINILPSFHDKLQDNFTLELIDSLEDIRQLLESYKYLNAIGATIRFQELSNSKNNGISIILSFSC